MLRKGKKLDIRDLQATSCRTFQEWIKDATYPINKLIIQNAKNVDNAFWTIAQQAIIYDQQDIKDQFQKSDKKIVLSGPVADERAERKCSGLRRKCSS